MKKAVKIPLIIVSVIVTLMILSTIGLFLILEPNVKIFGNSELDLDKLTSQSETMTVLDAYGDPIDEAMYDNDKLYVDVDDLPDHTKNAFIAIEDKRFYSHRGVDYKRMASALVSNIKAGKFREGASTITQQLIKNTHLSNEKTIRRKIEEIRLARKLERIYDKNQILECYLNILYFGAGIHGLGTASRIMFNKPASELSLAQSAALASIINNPSKYSPYSNYDNLMKRKNLVLDCMLKQGKISSEDYDVAISETLVFDMNKQTQFIGGLINDACATFNCNEKDLFIGNYTLKTAYNPSIAAEVRSAIKKYSDFTARVIVLDNESGGIVCDETNKNGYINPKRSPASAIKPFVSYAPALESGYYPMSQLSDEPTVFDDYSPSNYKNVYRGYISLRDGLVFSSNILAVDLLQKIGIDTCKNYAKNFGLSLTPEDDSLPIALGGLSKGVTLFELANAYRTLACGGTYSPAHYFTEAHNMYGNIYKTQGVSRAVVGDDTAYILTDILTECSQRGTAKSLKYSGIIAAKTGTNGDKNGNSDCYCIAYTPKLTIAVWFGADEKIIDNSITGASCCEVIKHLIKADTIKTDEPFPMPSSVAYYDIDGKALESEHEVYLANPILPKRYRRKMLISKHHIPPSKPIDIIDYFDFTDWFTD